MYLHEKESFSIKTFLAQTFYVVERNKVLTEVHMRVELVLFIVLTCTHIHRKKLIQYIQTFFRLKQLFISM